MLLLSYEILIALRHLKSRKRSHVISMLTLISILGVMVGVWALTVVLAVLSGFGQDLKKKIVESTPNMVIERHEGEFIRPHKVCKKLTSMQGLTSCSPFILNEVMLSSRNNNAGVVLRGIEQDAKRIAQITKQMRAGKFIHLFRPQEIPHERKQNNDIIFRLPSRPRRAAPAPRQPKPAPRRAAPAATRPAQRGTDPRAVPTSRRAKNPMQLPTLPGQELPGAPAASLPTSAPALRPRHREPSTRTPSPAPGLASGGYGLLELKRPKRRKRPGILLGQELAQSLSVSVGEVIRVVSPLGGSLTPMGVAPRVRKFRVAGIFFTGMYEYDTKFAFVTLKSAKKLFKMGQSVSGLELGVKNIYQTPQLKKTVRQRLGGGPYRVRDWIEMNSQLFGALQMEKIVMFVILTFIILVASFNIVSTLFMVVVEKSQEIAILKSMGATRSGIMRIFMVEGIVIGVIGTALGLLFGWRTCLFLLQHPIKMNTDVYYIATLPVQMNLYDFVSVAVASILLSFLATIYPALQAANLKPVEGLQHE